MCITASTLLKTLYFTTLLKLNSTMDVFSPSYTNLARAFISHHTLEHLLLITSCTYLLLKIAVVKLLGKLSIQKLFISFCFLQNFYQQPFFRTWSRVCSCNDLLSAKRKSREGERYKKK